jgi:hypothetical protein
MLRTLRHNNGHSTALTRPLETSTGRTTALKSNPTDQTRTSELPQLSTQDGGNSSDMKKDILSMSKERSSMSKEEEITKMPTSLYGTNIRDSTNNGILSTLMNTQMSQKRENLTKTSDSMLKDHSTLSLK